MTGEARHDEAADDSRAPGEDGHAAAPGGLSASLRLQPEFITRDDGRYHVAELLAFHDRPFVEAAFRAVLRRAPSPAESHATLSDLRNGRRAKIEIVRALARSEEGARQRATERVAGLKQSPFAAGVRDLPVVGHLWRVAAAVFRLPALLRDQQRFEAYALAQQQQIVEHFDARQHDFEAAELRLADAVEAVELRLADAVEAVELRLADAAAALSLLSDALAEISARHAEEQTRLARQIGGVEQRAAEQRRLLDGQQEFLIREQQAIVEAQKAALAAAEERLRELLSAHRRELAELSERVRSLPAAAGAAREAAGEEV